jgi:hypothetical protein
MSRVDDRPITALRYKRLKATCGPLKELPVGKGASGVQVGLLSYVGSGEWSHR